MSKLRFRIIYALDRRFRRLCWADLVAWALGYDGYTLREQWQDSRGRSCARECPSCYCGKFRAAATEGA